MAQFRTNHARNTKGSSGNIVKVGIFGALIAGLFYLFNLFSGKTESTANVPNLPEPEEPASYLPSSQTGQIIEHTYYSLSYNEQHEQAEWVAYFLSKERLSIPWVDRYDLFEPDPLINSGSATPDDYRNSGYDRGHLVAAADMAFNDQAMKETFYMSNISPQAKNFNKGIWKELEELSRDWAKKNDFLYVVSGPVLSKPIKGSIGKNEVSVPSAFFRVLLDLQEPQVKSIGFILPNEVSYEPLYKFAVSIDEVEEITGIDFFPDLLDDEAEEALESSFNLDLWEFNKQKFELRVNKWNKEEEARN